MTIAPGDSPVSNSSVVVVAPRRALTRAEKPCSAISPTVVEPVSNWGAGARPAVKGARVVRSSPVSRASYTLSTSVVITTSSTGSSAIGSTADPGAGRGAAAATCRGSEDGPHIGSSRFVSATILHLISTGPAAGLHPGLVAWVTTTRCLLVGRAHGSVISGRPGREQT